MTGSMPSPSPHFRCGFSLIESAIVLAVVGLVIGGIWWAAAKVMFNLKWNQTEEGHFYYINSIAKAFDSRTVSQMGYAIITPWVKNALPVPAGWRWHWNSAVGDELLDPFGHAIRGSETGIYGGVTPTFSFRYAGTLPKDICARTFVLYFQKIARKHRVVYFHPRPGCIPDSTKTYDYYATACCPGTMQMDWEAPMR